LWAAGLLLFLVLLVLLLLLLLLALSQSPHPLLAQVSVCQPAAPQEQPRQQLLPNRHHHQHPLLLLVLGRGHRPLVVQDMGSQLQLLMVLPLQLLQATGLLQSLVLQHVGSIQQNVLGN
jgi:hypothetical protein